MDVFHDATASSLQGRLAGAKQKGGQKSEGARLYRLKTRKTKNDCDDV